MTKFVSELFGLAGQSAVVIGGTGVLCGRMAEALAAAGARVLIAGREPDRASQRAANLTRSGAHAISKAVDVTSRESIQELLDFAIEQFAGVDILINGAGINSGVQYFSISDADAERLFDVNFMGVHRACQIFSKQMCVAGKGSIINIGSVSAILPLSRVFAYSASKSAVVNYSLNLARELAPSGVRVNVLTPGFFPAEQNRAILDEARRKSILDKTPMNRFGDPADLDGALLLLASSKAGKFITGHHLVVDGGFSIKSI